MIFLSTFKHLFNEQFLPVFQSLYQALRIARGAKLHSWVQVHRHSQNDYSK